MKRYVKRYSKKTPSPVCIIISKIQNYYGVLQKNKVAVESNGHTSNGAIKMPSSSTEQNSSNGLSRNLDLNGKSQGKHSDCNGQKMWSGSYPSTNVPRQRVNVGKLKD